MMVAIQFTNRFFGFQPEVRECGQFLQNLRPELLSIFAARVEMSCELVQVAPYPRHTHEIIKSVGEKRKVW